jgi:hypothetical protein
LRNRFNWLHREGALTDEELQARLARVDTFGRDNHSEASEPEQRTLN